MGDVYVPAQPPRQLIWVAAEQAKAHADVNAWLESVDPAHVLWYGAHATYPSVSRQTFQHYLGQSIHVLVFDAYTGFNPDAFAALCGCIYAGGVCIILSPERTQWPFFDDPEYQFLGAERNKVHAHAEAPQGHFLTRLQTMLTEHASSVLPKSYTASPLLNTLEHLAPNAAQKICIEKVIRVAKGHRRRPLVLTADRGRGKSTALGLACAQLLLSMHQAVATQSTQKEDYFIIVTAAHKQMTKALFEACRHALNSHGSALMTSDQPYHIKIDQLSLCFVSPDQLQQKPEKCDMLIVDEAAGFAISRIQSFIEHFPRLVLSTTVHGYEGSGRGFKLKIEQVLRDTCKQWAQQTLETPMRWAQDDPLEKWLYHVLLLNAEPPVLPDVRITPELCQVYALNKEHLLRDPALLSAVYGLLIQAHYRTTPGDLRQILDNPSLRVYGYWFTSHLVGVAVVAQEGGWSADVADAVFQGKQRFKGELLPQTLVYQLGAAPAASLAFARVVRIAIVPSHQSQTLGQAFMADLTQSLNEIDILGVACGATDQLIRFWDKQDFYPIKIALKQEASSGAYGIVMLKGMSSEGTLYIEHAFSEFIDAWPVMLMYEHKHMAGKVVHALAKYIGYEFTLDPLQDALLCQIEEGVRPANLHRALMQKQTWKKLASHTWSEAFEALIDTYLKAK